MLYASGGTSPMYLSTARRSLSAMMPRVSYDEAAAKPYHLLAAGGFNILRR